MVKYCKMTYLMNKYSMFYLQKDASDNITEYGDSFKEVIRQREKIQIPFLHTSPQISYRPGLIKYLKKLCTDKKFSHCCLHLAIYLMDTFMDCHNIGPERILLLANVCLLLAAKFEENINKIPKISELNAIVNFRYTLKEYRDWEVIVLDYFSWYILFPTVAHYAHYYTQAVISQEDIDKNNSSLRSLLFRIHDSIVEYLDQIIENVHYMQDFKPSQLAATVIAASRLDVGLSAWTGQLEQITDYSKEDIRGLLYTIKINKYNNVVGPMQIYSRSLLCTFRQNFCESCRIISCTKCNFLRKI